MSSAIETQINKRNTKAFIDANPMQVSLIAQSHDRTASGGYKLTKGQARDPITVRLISQSNAIYVFGPTQKTIDGVEHSSQWMILAEADTDIRLYDTWTDTDGAVWEVTRLWPPNSYETRAVVVKHGE